MSQGINLSLEHTTRSDALIALHAFTKYLIPLQPRSKVAHFDLIRRQRGHLSAQYCLPETSWKLFLHEPPTEAEAREWLQIDSEVNWAVVLGKRSGLMVAEEDGGTLPFPPGQTVTAESQRGAHYYFLWRPDLQNTKSPDDWELRVNDCYVVAPGSVHESGHIYRWKPRHGPDELTPSVLLVEPSLFTPSATTQPDKAHRQDSSVIVEGSRHSTLVSLAGSMRRVNMSESAIRAGLLAENNTKCQPPLPKEEVQRIAHDIASKPATAGQNRRQTATPTIARPPTEEFTLAELMSRNFPEPEYVLKDMITADLNILGGPQKSGKSILVQGVSLAVALGGVALGRVPVERRGIAYLAYEDKPQLLQKRFRDLLDDGAPPNNFHILTRSPTIVDSGLEHLDSWLCQQPDVGLVVIDTLARFRGDEGNRTNVYMNDYQVVSNIKRLCDDRKLACILIHHTRKEAHDDPINELTGSTGLTAACDSVSRLKRARGAADGSLLVTGRCLPDQEFALRFDGSVSAWTLLGLQADYVLSTRRQNILDVVKAAGAAVTPKEVADELPEEKYATVKSTMWRMLQSGELSQPETGKYAPPSASLQPPQPSDLQLPLLDIANTKSVEPITAEEDWRVQL